ncbi:transcriptional regulator [Enterococcus sp. JM4C]|uniref:helix-turn-helix domain-containing protein n=1 Tax=Candidatus Enterococcus huntleyi TaxID=1857217 RepID=UPI00137A62CF|nr:RodZ domain-containing protein [Enterococcus sp. JM4C]KAF1295200.1 transcriptional regulator [Enterococcus sp. JM4C]
MANGYIGDKLRQARLDKNISLDELQQMTKIQKRYLEAIESDNYDSLPGTFYVRAFIRQYANAVGEDGEHLVAVFNGEEDLYPVDRIKRPEPELANGSRKDIYEDEHTPSRFVRSLPAIALGLVALAILIVVFYYTWQNRQSDPIIGSPASSVSVENEVTTETTESSSQTAETSTSSSSTESTTQESSTTESEEPKMKISLDSQAGDDVNMTFAEATSPIKLDFEGQNDICWIGIMVDGAYIYQYTLQPDEKQSTTLPENLANATIVIGAGANVKIKANNEAVNFNPKNEALRKNVNLTVTYQQ